MLPFLVAGIVLGFSAGVAPGPLLALIIAETLQHNVKAGIKVALSPIVTDLPIVLVTLFVLTGLSRFQAVLGVISISGGFFVCWLGYQNIRITHVNIRIEIAESPVLHRLLVLLVEDSRALPTW